MGKVACGATARSISIYIYASPSSQVALDSTYVTLSCSACDLESGLRHKNVSSHGQNGSRKLPEFLHILFLI